MLNGGLVIGGWDCNKDYYNRGPHAPAFHTGPPLRCKQCGGPAGLQESATSKGVMEGGIMMWIIFVEVGIMMRMIIRVGSLSKAEFKW